MVIPTQLCTCTCLSKIIIIRWYQQEGIGIEIITKLSWGATILDFKESLHILTIDKINICVRRSSF